MIRYSQVFAREGTTWSRSKLAGAWVGTGAVFQRHSTTMGAVQFDKRGGWVLEWWQTHTLGVYLVLSRRETGPRANVLIILIGRWSQLRKHGSFWRALTGAPSVLSMSALL
jgi:hypothetical protein